MAATITEILARLDRERASKPQKPKPSPADVVVQDKVEVMKAQPTEVVAHGNLIGRAMEIVEQQRRQRPKPIDMPQVYSRADFDEVLPQRAYENPALDMLVECAYCGCGRRVREMCEVELYKLVCHPQPCAPAWDKPQRLAGRRRRESRTFPSTLEVRDHMTATMIGVLQRWLDQTAEACNRERIPVTDDFQFRALPDWASRGMLKAWVAHLRGLEQAAGSIVALPLDIDRRHGRFRLPQEWYEDHLWELIGAVQRDMVVLYTGFYGVTSDREFTALSPHFDVIEDGTAPPWYSPVVHPGWLPPDGKPGIFRGWRRSDNGAAIYV